MGRLLYYYLKAGPISNRRIALAKRHCIGPLEEGMRKLLDYYLKVELTSIGRIRMATRIGGYMRHVSNYCEIARRHRTMKRGYWAAFEAAFIMLWILEDYISSRHTLGGFWNIVDSELRIVRDLS